MMPFNLKDRSRLVFGRTGLAGSWNDTDAQQKKE